MIRLILSGCNGKVGRAVVSYLAARRDIKIVAGITSRPFTN